MKEKVLSGIFIILSGVILLLSISAPGDAGIPETISYQGYLTDSTGVAIDGPVNLTFRIYDVATAGPVLWSEPQSVTVNNGVYSVQLGSVSTLTDLNFDVPYWLGVEVGIDGEMDPRQPFDSVPFAVISAMSEFATSAQSATSADYATSVADGSVIDSSISGPISASKIDHLGLNADLLDDMDSAEFATALHVHGGAEISPQGSGSGLDADLLDGQDSVAFATASHSHGSADITPPLSLISGDISGITINGVSTHVNGIGVRGEGNDMGVSGYTQDDNGVGVYGLSGTTGANFGVYGYSRSPDGHGVHGLNDAGGYAGYFDGDVELTGTLIGDGSGLTNLNAIQITMGTLLDSRLSVNVDLLDAGQTVTGVKNFAPSSGTVPFTVHESKIGPVTNLNADLLDGQHSSEIIAAAVDEVRSPIEACGIVITSGSYYVTDNLVGTVGHCIKVSADNVTIDLMGFTLTDDGSGNDYGIFLNGVSNVEIKNGTVTNFSTGVYASNSNNSNSNRMINVRAVANVINGITLNSRSNFIKNCTANENIGYGVHAGAGSTVTNNTANNNQREGISTGVGSTVTNNTANNNQFFGMNIGTGSTVTNNTAYNNRNVGINVSFDSTVTNNTANNNQNHGMSINGNSLVMNNTANNNELKGMQTGNGSQVIGNVTVNNNVDFQTDGGGITVGEGSYVKGNSSLNNRINNIVVWGIASIIEENFVTNSANGINFKSAGNFYANNRASGNTTNYAGILPTGDGDGGGNVSF